MLNLVIPFFFTIIKYLMHTRQCLCALQCAKLNMSLSWKSSQSFYNGEVNKEIIQIKWEHKLELKYVQEVTKPRCLQ